MYDITPIINAVIALFAAIVTAVIIPYIKSRTSETQLRKTLEWARIAVSAAEQIYGAGGGEQKFEYAARWLRDRGIGVDIYELRAYIEDAVHEMNSSSLSNQDFGEEPDFGEEQPE